MSYSQAAYNALALYIREAVEESTYRDPDFEVGNSYMHKIALVNDSREKAAAWEFFSALSADEKYEIVRDAVFALSGFSEKATETLREYVAECDKGYADDKATDELRDRMAG